MCPCCFARAKLKALDAEYHDLTRRPSTKEEITALREKRYALREVLADLEAAADEAFASMSEKV